MSGAILSAGFADPVLNAQGCFRAVLDAMSRPGRVHPLSAAPMPPVPLCAAAGAVLLTLADNETPLWLDAGSAVADWLRFHCGCPIAAEPGAAAFVLATGAPPPLTAIFPGTDEEPHRGGTLLLQVEALTEGGGWRLSGPGIEREHRLRIVGAPPGFVAAWKANRALFPRGVDVILCAGNGVAALPRGTMVEED